MATLSDTESNWESPYDATELRKALVLVMQHAGKELTDGDADVLVETLLTCRNAAQLDDLNHSPERSSWPATEPVPISSGNVGNSVHEDDEGDTLPRLSARDDQEYYEGRGEDRGMSAGSLDPSWLGRHPKAATVLEEHPEMHSLMVDMVERQEELMFAVEQAEAARKKKEQDYLEHVEYLENMSVAEIEKARQQQQANRQATILRLFHNELSVEDIFDQLVKELANKEDEMEKLRHEQSKLKGEIAEMDYQQAQRHRQYSEEQRRLTEEMSKMRAQLREAQERSLRRRTRTQTNTSLSARSSLLIEHLQGVADEKTAESEHLRAELAKLQHQRDEEDLSRAKETHLFPPSVSNSLTASYMTNIHRSMNSNTPVMMVMSTSDDCTGADLLDDDNVADRLASLRRAKVAVLREGNVNQPSLREDLASAVEGNREDDDGEYHLPPEGQMTTSHRLKKFIGNVEQGNKDVTDSVDQSVRTDISSSSVEERIEKPTMVQAREDCLANQRTHTTSAVGDHNGQGGASTLGRVVVRDKSGMTAEKKLNRKSAPAAVEWRAVSEPSVRNAYQPPPLLNSLSLSRQTSSLSAKTEEERAAHELRRSRIFNVAVLGDSGVGKTTFIRMFGSSDYEPVSIPQSTIGVDFVVKSAVVDQQEVTLKMWDTAGSERFHSIAKNYLRRCEGVIMMFDITNKRTFESLSKWRNDVLDTCHDHAALLMIGNKMDLVDRGQAAKVISMDEAMTMANTINSAMYLEVSGQQGDGVSEACTILTRAMLAKEDQAIMYSSQLRLFGLSEDDDVIKTGPCCCK